VTRHPAEKPSRPSPSRAAPLAAGAARLALASALLLPVAQPARADQLDLAGRKLTRGRILGIEQGELRFRLEDSNILAAKFTEIERLHVDPVGDFADLNAAEQFVAENEPGKAIARYERQLRTADAFWRDLLHLRLMRACDRAGQIDKAVTYFLRIMEDDHTGPAVAAQVMPFNLPAAASPVTRKAVEQLDRFAAGRDATDKRALATLLLFDVLRAVKEDRARALAPQIAELMMSPAIRTPRTGAIQLTAFRDILSGEPPPAAMKWLERAIGGGDASVLPDLLLLKGEALLRRATTNEDRLRAGWTFMRVAIHFSGDPRAAEGLIRAAEVHASVARKDRAKALLEEAIKHPEATPESRRKAEDAMRNL